jgi:hypothetical protein
MISFPRSALIVIHKSIYSVKNPIFFWFPRACVGTESRRFCRQVKTRLTLYSEQRQMRRDCIPTQARGNEKIIGIGLDRMHKTHRQ